MRWRRTPMQAPGGHVLVGECRHSGLQPRACITAGVSMTASPCWKAPRDPWAVAAHGAKALCKPLQPLMRLPPP